jgi:hypothetical protein
MFRSQKSKSLKVQRETVRVLAGSQLASAQGGTLQVGGRFEGVTGDCQVLTQGQACTQLGGNNDTTISRTAAGGGCGTIPITSGRVLPPSLLP